MKSIRRILIVAAPLIFASCATTHRIPTSIRGGEGASKATQLNINITYMGLDSKWISYLSSEANLPDQQKDGSLTLPGVTTKFGQQVKLEFVQVYRSDKSLSEGPSVPCGILININSAVAGNTIKFSGTSVLRRPTNRISQGQATNFAAQENLIDVTLQDGMTKAIELDGGGQMMIKATLTDAAGRPTKSQANKP
jgi:hypothetical protein